MYAWFRRIIATCNIICIIGIGHSNPLYFNVCVVTIKMALLTNNIISDTKTHTTPFLVYSILTYKVITVDTYTRVRYMFSKPCLRHSNYINIIILHLSCQVINSVTLSKASSIYTQYYWWSTAQSVSSRWNKFISVGSQNILLTAG